MVQMRSTEGLTDEYDSAHWRFHTAMCCAI